MIGHGELRNAAAGTVGIHAATLNGVTWTEPKAAYSLYCDWATAADRAKLGRRETPQLLLEPGTNRPVALFNSGMPCGCAYGNPHVDCNWGNKCKSFSMATTIFT